MITLEIIENDEYANYTVIDQNGNKHNMNINFMNMEKPKIGTRIYISESVIKENVSLNYGPVENKNSSNPSELITLISPDEVVYLQRYYG